MTTITDDELDEIEQDAIRGRSGYGLADSPDPAAQRDTIIIRLVRELRKARKNAAQAGHFRERSAAGNRRR